MTIKGVETAIKHVRTVYGEWKDQGFDYWREEHTRYAMIAPIIRALGWKTCDPKECHREYTRFKGDKAGRVDNAFFLNRSLECIGNGTVAPDMIIEVKNPSVDLEGSVEQLCRSTQARPLMKDGVAALANGKEWWLYDIGHRGTLRNKPSKCVPMALLQKSNLMQKASS